LYVFDCFCLWTFIYICSSFLRPVEMTGSSANAC
jgi:hypothetical protein